MHKQDTIHVLNRAKRLTGENVKIYILIMASYLY